MSAASEKGKGRRENLRFPAQLESSPFSLLPSPFFAFSLSTDAFLSNLLDPTGFQIPAAVSNPGQHLTRRRDPFLRRRM